MQSVRPALSFAFIPYLVLLPHPPSPHPSCGPPTNMSTHVFDRMSSFGEPVTGMFFTPRDMRPVVHPLDGAQAQRGAESLVAVCGGGPGVLKGEPALPLGLLCTPGFLFLCTWLKNWPHSEWSEAPWPPACPHPAVLLIPFIFHCS